MKKRQMICNFIKGSLTVLFSVLIIYGVAQANSSITPPSGTPIASFFTLSDIWTRLTTNGTASEGTHSFTFADPLAGTHVTLTQIYNAIPTIDATKVLFGTSYLGIAGTMVDKTGLSVASTAQSQLTGVNYFTAVQGYYDGTAKVSATDAEVRALSADIVTGNILSGKTIFGIGGKTEVVDTTEATVPITTGTVSAGKKGFVNGALVTGTGIISLGNAVNTNVLAGTTFSNATAANIPGTMADKTGLSVASTAQSQLTGVNYFTAVQGYYDGTAKVSATDAEVRALSADIVTGNILSGKTIFGIGGKTSVVDTADATADNSKILNTYTAYVNGVKITGIASAGNNYGIPKTSQQPTLPTGTPFQTGDDAYYANPGGGTGTDVGYPKGKVNWAGYNADGGRFTDNTDGTITDNATGLEWIKSPTTSPGAPFNAIMTWTNAITNCEALNYAGHSGGGVAGGWRLPNVKELQSIVDYGRVSPAIDPLFTNTQSDYYWSSTTGASNTANAWYVYFFNGYVYNDAKTVSIYVRCVRG